MYYIARLVWYLHLRVKAKVLKSRVEKFRQIKLLDIFLLVEQILGVGVVIPCMPVQHCLLNPNCPFVAGTLVYKYTTLFGRVLNGCLHDFKFTQTCLNFRTILYVDVQAILFLILFDFVKLHF